MLLETAACDGPVKFHRVVNKYFAVDLKQSMVPSAEETQSGSGDGSQEDDGDNEKTLEDDRHHDTGGETYSCVYCNHVFKSHYCYQKHKR